MTSFDLQLDQRLRTEANPAIPAGLEQRLLARLSNEPCPLDRSEAPISRPTPLFTSAQRMTPQRSAASAWTAFGLHAAAILLLAFTLAHKAGLIAPRKQIVATLELPTPPPPVPPRHDTLGGGGGQHDVGPATAGHLPKLAQTQIVPPKAPPTVAPKLAIEPTVVVQPDLKLAENHLPNIGAPDSTLRGFSMGNGSGTGIGSGNGSGIGPGSGGNIGGGIYHVGGSVKAPILVHEVSAEFSEEARKAKFSGDVLVSLIIDEAGEPSHVHCARDVGMGLCDKAVEAVRQYRFRPATQNGKPVKVEMNVDVNFEIF